jgi:predicted Na+-dependent transporter
MNAGTATTAGVNMDPAQLLTLAFQISITLTVFVFGLGATVEDVLHLVRRPRMLVISLVSNVLTSHHRPRSS